jgi:UDP-N-acetylglucosamine 2-epimerase (non-hydrolysing)
MHGEPLNVLVLFGTRPEAIKLAPVIARLRGDDRFRARVVMTSQHREMVEGPLRLFSIRPDHDLQVMQPEQSLTDVATRTLEGLDPLLRDERPDFLLVQGDTTSAFAGALAAFHRRVPVGHVEAGLRSHDKLHPYPEEINRRLISVAADLHFAPTESAERNLLREGIDAQAIFVTGNTVIDALQEVLGRNGNALDRTLPPASLEGRRLVLVTAHRRESFEGPLAELCHGLRELVAAYPDLLVLYPVHLNPAVRRTVEPILGGHECIRLVDPLPYEGFVEAMARSHLIVTDSGGVQEEAPSLGKPVLVFRKVTERGEGVAARGAKLVGLSRRRLVEEASRLLDDPAAYREMTRHRDLYGDGHASRRIVEAILSHFGRGERPGRFTPRDSG